MGAGGRAVWGLAAMAAAFWYALSGAAAAQPAMWMVRDADSEIYLFGTLHMLNDGDASWRTPLFNDVYARAGTLWFEADVGDPDEARALIDRYGVDPARPLTAKLNARTVRRLQPLLERERIPLSAVDSMRPWAAAMMLTVQPLLNRGYSMQKGADAVITDQAHGSTKQVRDFETVEDQMRMLATLPQEVEVQYLEDVIDGQVKPARDGRTLQWAWEDGRLDLMAKWLVDDMRRHRPQLYRVLLKDRNEAWARALTVEMRGNGVELVNVGALHMIGKDGLPALLKARGFEVERVQ
jgi:uncharacterized protein YbaP (TraB family)